MVCVQYFWLEDTARRGFKIFIVVFVDVGLINWFNLEKVFWLAINVKIVTIFLKNTNKRTSKQKQYLYNWE